MTGAFGLHAERLAAYGYAPIPISLPTDGGLGAGKRPALPRWQEGCPREAWPACGRYGVGVLTRNTPALDIDVRDPWLAESPIAETQAPAGAPSARGLPDLPDPVQYDRAGAIQIARELLDHIERGTRDRPTSSAYLHDVAEVACIEEHLLATGGLATVSVEGEA